MSTSTSSSSMLNDLVGDLYSRRLLLIHSTTVYQPPFTATAPSAGGGNNSFDANVVMVLSVVLCALVCSLGLNFIIRCALRCSVMVSSGSGSGSPSSANTGVKRKAIKSFTTVSYSPEMNLPGLDTECVICLSEFAAGERVRLLPKCHHGFHVGCIDKWLSSHSSCPTCRDCLIETCQKIVGVTCGVVPVVLLEAPAVVLPVELREVLVVNIIAPLAPEGHVRNYRVIS